MGAVYPSALEQFLQAGIDLSAVTVKVQAVSAGYVYSATHDFLDDVGAGTRLGTALTLTGKTFTGGTFDANPGTYLGLVNGNVVRGFVGFVSTGVDATSRLVWYEDTNDDESPINYTSDGAALPLQWLGDKIFSI